MSQQTAYNIIKACTPENIAEVTFPTLIESKAIIKENLHIFTKEDKVEAKKALRRINEKIITLLFEGRG